MPLCVQHRLNNEKILAPCASIGTPRPPPYLQPDLFHPVVHVFYEKGWREKNREVLLGRSSSAGVKFWQ